MFAVIESGGKQYRVDVGKAMKVEKLEVEPGQKVIFDKVLLKADKSKVLIGQPYLKDVSVEGKATSQGREDKKIVFRYHSKTRYRKKKGHRQFYTALEISKIK